MGYECRVERDSVSPDGVRLTTFVLCFPRFILPEVLTYRVLSRNGASSRAVPVERRIEEVRFDPFVPEAFGRNQRGMVAGEALADDEDARGAWLDARDAALRAARDLARVGVHKQWANRLLEPFAWHRAVVSGTDWANLFAQRRHPDAQPEFLRLAEMMWGAMAASTPEPVPCGRWHLPMLTDQERDEAGKSSEALRHWKLVSAGRCARVSYETHDGRRDPAADALLGERLIAARPPHGSVFEHQATPAPFYSRVSGNYRGWRQFRHEIAGESVPG